MLVIANTKEIDGVMNLSWGNVTKELFEDDDLETFIQVVDGEVVALIQVLDMLSYVKIETLVLTGDENGDKLLEYVCDIYTHLQMYVRVGWNNETLISLYKRFGFTTRPRISMGTIAMKRGRMVEGTRWGIRGRPKQYPRDAKILVSPEKMGEVMMFGWGNLTKEWFADKGRTAELFEDDLETFIKVKNGEVVAVLHILDMDTYVSIEALVDIPGNGHAVELLEYVCGFYQRVPMAVRVDGNHETLIPLYKRFDFTTKSRILDKGIVNLNKKGSRRVRR